MHSEFFPERGTQKSSLFFLLFLISLFLPTPIPKTKQNKHTPKQKNPSHCPVKKTICCEFSSLSLSLYLALECMFLCSMSKNWTNKQLPTMGRKPIPSPSSLLVLIFDGSNPVPKSSPFSASSSTLPGLCDLTIH